MRRSAWALAILIALAWGCGLAVAQDNRPYAGFERRPIKALSAEQAADLRAGRGMGLALAAELNGYPGPLHVIQLAGELGLSAEQKAAVEHLFARMKAEAVPLGERLIAQEAELDRAFAERTVTPQSLSAATAAIGETLGALRRAHLHYHLSTAAVLTRAQMQRYAELRGYARGPAVQGGERPQHHQHRH